MPLAALLLAAAANASASPYAIRGNLEPLPEARTDGRISIRGSLEARPPTGRVEGLGFKLSGLLDTDADPACVRPDRIFRDGLESPPAGAARS